MIDIVPGSGMTVVVNDAEKELSTLPPAPRIASKSWNDWFGPVNWLVKMPINGTVVRSLVSLTLPLTVNVAVDVSDVLFVKLNGEPFGGGKPGVQV